MEEPTPAFDAPATRSRNFAALLRGWFGAAAGQLRGHWARILAIAALGAGVIGIVGHTLGGLAGIWEFYRVAGPGGPGKGDAQVAERSAAPTARSGERPFRSVAVLPFTVDARMPEDELLARTLGREMTAAASRALREGLVISFGTAQQVSERTRDPRRTADQLNVRYLVEGDLRAKGEGRELALELIDAVDGSQLWSARQPVSPGDPTATVTKLINPLRDAILAATTKEVRSLPKRQRDAWDHVFRAWETSENAEGFRERERHLEEALRLDPKFVPALIGLQKTLFVRAQEEPERRAEIVRRFDDVSKRAIDAAPSDPRAWAWRAYALQRQDNWGGAFAANDEALRLDPFRSETHVDRASLNVYAGRAKEALEAAARAAELQGKAVAADWQTCLAYQQLQRDADAVPACERAATSNYWVAIALAVAAHANAGNAEKAAGWKQKMLEANPQASVARLADLGVSNHPDFKARAQHFYDGLRKAGVPER